MKMLRQWHTIGVSLKFAKLIVSSSRKMPASYWPFISVRPIQDYAKSCMEVAEYEMRIPNGDLNLARDYLELVAGSNAEDVGRASELLKDVKTRIYNNPVPAQTFIKTHEELELETI